MRKQFKEFYHKEQVDLKNLDGQTLVVVDANVLLNVYRFSKKSKATLLKALKVVEKNLWIPYQVGLEFNKSRIGIIENRKEYMNSIDKQISDTLEKQKKVLLKEIEETLGDLGVKSKDKDAVKKSMLENLDELLSKEIKEWEKTGTDKIHNLIGDVDENCNELIDILDGKVGEQLTQKEMDTIIRDGEERYQVSYPPSNEDDEKGQKRYGKVTYDSKYRNYIVWENIIQKARKENMSHVVFITDDNKESWVYGSEEKRRGPRFELKKELLDIIGADLTILNSNSFLQETLGETNSVIDFNHAPLEEEEVLVVEEQVDSDELVAYKNNQKLNEIERMRTNVDAIIKSIESRLDQLSETVAQEILQEGSERYINNILGYQDAYAELYQYFKKLRRSMAKKITIDNAEFFINKMQTVVNKLEALDYQAYKEHILKKEKKEAIDEMYN